MCYWFVVKCYLSIFSIDSRKTVAMDALVRNSLHDFGIDWVQGWVEDDSLNGSNHFSALSLGRTWSLRTQNIHKARLGSNRPTWSVLGSCSLAKSYNLFRRKVETYYTKILSSRFWGFLVVELFANLMGIISSGFFAFATFRWPSNHRVRESNLVDSASSHTLVSKIKPCMSKYNFFTLKTANGSLYQL